MAKVLVEKARQERPKLPCSPRCSAKTVALGLLFFLGGWVDAQDTQSVESDLVASVKANNADRVAALLAAGVNVNEMYAGGLTILHVAAVHGAEDVVAVLIDAGANIDARANETGQGITALHAAVISDSLECVELLLRRGAAVDAPAAATVGTPLLLAVHRGNQYAAIMLLEHGADANAKNDRGETAWAIAEREGMTEVLVHMYEANPKGISARDIDPEIRRRLLLRGVARDDSAMVLRLLDDRGMGEFRFWLLQAAHYNSPRVAEALLDAGVDANYGTTTPLHRAAHQESSDVAALLIERGAEVDARDAIGWTPLHYALLKDVDRPALRVAHMLLVHGADVNAATPALGWTPLHFAAHLSSSYVDDFSDEPDDWEVELVRGPDVLEIVQTLIERGADVGVRTRIGGWSPARVARASDQGRHQSFQSSPSSKAVHAAIQAAGGKDEGCDDAPMLPVYAGGQVLAQQDRPTRNAAVSPGCKYNLPFAVPGATHAGGRAVAGSFTRPSADEGLLFANVGSLAGGLQFDLISLQDQRGAVRPIMAFDHYTHYEGLCFDRVRGTHTAVFTREYDGDCCPWVDTVYYHYDADAGDFVEALVHDLATQPTGKDAVCRWRDTKADLDAYQAAVSVLQVGESPSWSRGALTERLWKGPLPTRLLSAAAVESQLRGLRELPHVVDVSAADIDSPRWKVGTVSYLGARREPEPVCEGVLLVWDEAQREWRSIYDCAAFLDAEVHANTLSAALHSARCGNPQLDGYCYLEVDLTTWQSQLWDEPHGDNWSHDRTRPER